MRFRGRRRRKAAWVFADQALLQLSNAALFTFHWVLPPARVNFLCDTDRVDSLVYKGSHHWMDFWWSNTGSATTVPDVLFYMVVSQMDAATGNPTELALNPFASPSTPSSITSWEEFDVDGTDSFLWVHHIKGQSPPNAMTRPLTDSGSALANQNNIIDGGTADQASELCRKFTVVEEWQPDVRVKVSRRLRKDEGVVLVMKPDSPPNLEVRVNLQHRFRTLVARGR